MEDSAAALTPKKDNKTKKKKMNHIKSPVLNPRAIPKLIDIKTSSSGSMFLSTLELNLDDSTDSDSDFDSDEYVDPAWVVDEELEEDRQRVLETERKKSARAQEQEKEREPEKGRAQSVDIVLPSSTITVKNEEDESRLDEIQELTEATKNKRRSSSVSRNNNRKGLLGRLSGEFGKSSSVLPPSYSTGDLSSVREISAAAERRKLEEEPQVHASTPPIKSKRTSSISFALSTINVPEKKREKRLSLGDKYVLVKLEDQIVPVLSMTNSRDSQRGAIGTPTKAMKLLGIEDHQDVLRMDAARMAWHDRNAMDSLDHLQLSPRSPVMHRFTAGMGKAKERRPSKGDISPVHRTSSLTPPPSPERAGQQKIAHAVSDSNVQTIGRHHTTTPIITATSPENSRSERTLTTPRKLSLSSASQEPISGTTTTTTTTTTCTTPKMTQEEKIKALESQVQELQQQLKKAEARLTVKSRKLRRLRRQIKRDKNKQGPPSPGGNKPDSPAEDVSRGKKK